MRKLYFLIMIFTIISALQAIPASQELITVQQPNGTEIQIRLNGDEYYHWYEDVEGYTIIQNNEWWYYANLNSQGNLENTYIPVGSSARKELLPEKHLRSQIAVQKAKENRKERMNLVRENNKSKRNLAKGVVKNLVVLVDFPNKAGEKTEKEFDDLFNLPGYNFDETYGSVRDYYLESSYGQVEIQSVIAPWVTVSKNYQYYGQNAPDGEIDINIRDLITEALTILNNKSYNFKQFDLDNDGWIDMFDVIHAGYGEEFVTNSEDLIWSHQWGLEEPFVTHDGVKIQMYHIEPEFDGREAVNLKKIVRIGVICHESGHFFGLPDLYDTDYSSSGTGDWCIMSGGTFKSRARPIHFCAWAKYTLGWLTPTEITNNGEYSLKPSADNKDIYYIKKGFPGKQYLMIENKQYIGFDSDIPQNGILIWRIDDAKYDNDSEWLPGRDASKHYLVQLIQPDGKWDLEYSLNYGDMGDVFHEEGIQVLSSSIAANPNSGYYGTSKNLDYSGVEIFNIQSAKDAPVSKEMIFSVTFNQVPSAPSLISPIQNQQNLPHTIVFEWQPSIDSDGDSITYQLKLEKLTSSRTFEAVGNHSIFPINHNYNHTIKSILYSIFIIISVLGFFLLALAKKQKTTSQYSLLCSIVFILLISICLLACNHNDKKPGEDGINIREARYNLEPNSTYQWHVIANDGRNGIAQSEIRTFTTR